MSLIKQDILAIYCSVFNATIKRIFISAALLFSVTSIAQTSLPLPPEQLSNPYPRVSVTSLKTAEELILLFKHHHYSLDNVLSAKQIPAYFVENVPDDLHDLPVQQKISGFIRLMLPTIRAVNDQILAVRDQIEILAKKPAAQWSKTQTAWINSLFTRYSVRSKKLDELLLRVDVIPVGMALAQSINESGWGTSYFAIEGNSLYGEHLSAAGGKHLSTPSGNAKVAAFDNIYQGTASYVHNLNTTLAYQQMRQLRKQLRTENKLTGYELVAALSTYSARGEAYIKSLRNLITNLRLDSYEKIRLKTYAPLRIKFSR